MFPQNIVDLSDKELNVLLCRGPHTHLLSESQLMDMIDYFVRHEKVDHIYVLSAWTVGLELHQRG